MIFNFTDFAHQSTHGDEHLFEKFEVFIFCSFAMHVMLPPRFSYNGIRARLFIRQISFKLCVLCFRKAFDIKIVDAKSERGQQLLLPS